MKSSGLKSENISLPAVHDLPGISLYYVPGALRFVRGPTFERHRQAASGRLRAMYDDAAERFPTLTAHRRAAEAGPRARADALQIFFDDPPEPEAEPSNRAMREVEGRKASRTQYKLDTTPQRVRTRLP